MQTKNTPINLIQLPPNCNNKILFFFPGRKRNFESGNFPHNCQQYSEILTTNFAFTNSQVNQIEASAVTYVFPEVWTTFAQPRELGLICIINPTVLCLLAHNPLAVAG